MTFEDKVWAAVLTELLRGGVFDTVYTSTRAIAKAIADVDIIDSSAFQIELLNVKGETVFLIAYC